MSVLVLVVNDVKCRKYTTKNISTKDLCDYFLKLVGFSTFCNVGIANKRMWVASQPASFHLLYIGRARASLPPYTSIPWGYAYPLMIACSLISTYSRGTEVPNAPEEGRSVNKSRAIALHVSTNSVWFLQHCQQIQFIMRESIRGKQEKRSKKLPRKSIQWYFAMYPRINRQVSSITLPSILASFFAFPATSGEENQRSKSLKQFRDAKGRNHPGQQMRFPTPSCQTWINAKQARCKKQKRLPRERDSLLLISLL